MIISNIRLSDSALDSSRTRLCADIQCDSIDQRTNTCWIDLPQALDSSAVLDGSPWVVAFLPLAMAVGEDIRVESSVDVELYENLHDLMLIWQEWCDNYRRVAIVADINTADEAARPTRIGAFFSGGADAFFTALRHTSQTSEGPALRINDLVFVRGFDIPIDRVDVFDRLVPKYQAIASELDCQLIDIATNFRDVVPEKLVPWGPVGHGAALAAVAQATRTYRKLLVASDGWGLDVFPWGTHPLTDPLMSSSHTSLVHDGVTFRRTEKLRFLADFEVARRNLRVCWRAKSDNNCSQCEKCYRTMAALDALGVLGEFKTFDSTRYSTSLLKRMFIKGRLGRQFMGDVSDLALRHDRRDIFLAIRSAMRRSRWKGACIQAADWCQQKRGLWRLASPLRKRALQNSAY